MVNKIIIPVVHLLAEINRSTVFFSSTVAFAASCCSGVAVVGETPIIYLTVTLFAKFRGKSGLFFRKTARW
jgi:hypothetical protein